MKTQAERLKILMNERRVPERKQKRALERASGARYETVRQWFEKNLDNITSEYLFNIAKAYSCEFEWLAAGMGDMDVGAKYDNGRGISDSVRRIPVLSYIEAGDPKPVVDSYLSGAGMDDISLDSETEQEISMESFALKVSGNSMEPEFRDGDVVIVDPSVKPDPGDVVVASITEQNEATIKKYRSRGNDSLGHHVFELVPLNEDYHTIVVSSENPGHIIGTVVEHRRKRRKRP